MQLKLISVLLIPLLLLGCATRTGTAGRDFDSSKISQIQKGVTTTSQIQSLFGDPFKKEVVSPTEVKWTYAWIQLTATTVVLSATSPTTYVRKRTRKVIWLTIKDDIVVDYTFKEGPF